MKLIQWSVLFVSILFLTACGEQSYEPQEVNPETDVCQICNMSITHVDFAAQAVFKNGDHLVFDDLGCLMDYILQNGEQEIGASYIRDTNSAQWLNIQEAVYVYSKDYWTPMSYGVLAFSSQQEAESYLNEQPGKLLQYEDLLTFNWGVHEHE